MESSLASRSDFYLLCTIYAQVHAHVYTLLVNLPAYDEVCILSLVNGKYLNFSETALNVMPT